MSLLVTLDPQPEFDPKVSKAPPERLISGDPTFSTWLQDTARDGSIRTGVWESTPGENLTIKGESFEFCHILSGIVEITEHGNVPVRYVAGDSFLMKPGFSGTWKTVETVRKLFVISNP
jgi:uncharacterized protein